MDELKCATSYREQLEQHLSKSNGKRMAATHQLSMVAV